MARFAKLLVIIMALLVVPSAALAGTIGFYQITDNGNTPVAGQFGMTVTGSDGLATFLFTNQGPVLSSICDIYFDDGTLLGIATIASSTGVSFSFHATPGDLPGGNSISPVFKTTQDFSADSDSPVASNGVNPGEWVSITFKLINGKTIADTLAALDSGELRVGLHVQAIGVNGGSESFVNKVPEPSLVLLLGIGLGAVTLVSKRWKN
jgi:hypothetical protein